MPSAKATAGPRPRRRAGLFLAAFPDRQRRGAPPSLSLAHRWAAKVSRSCTRDLLRQRAVDRDDVEAIHDVLFLSLGSPAVERAVVPSTGAMPIKSRRR